MLWFLLGIWVGGAMAFSFAGHAEDDSGLRIWWLTALMCLFWPVSLWLFVEDDADAP